MNISCIYTVGSSFSCDKPLPSQAAIPFGIAIIATCLKNAGYNPTVFVFTPASDFELIINNYIDKYEPKLFCLTAVSTQFSFIMKIAELIKRKDPEIFILLGGVHVTLNPEKSIQEPYIDAICIGEGEIAVVELANQIKNGNTPSRINNLWIKKPGEIERNVLSDFLQDLDSIPIIDRSLWSSWFSDMNNQFSIIIGRGCPNNCAYCCNHVLKKICSGKYVRYRSPENIIKEIVQLINHNSKINEIYLECETLSINLNYTFNLLKELGKFNAALIKPISFRVNLSMVKNIIDNHFFEQLKGANFTSVNIGLESGSEKLRNEVLRRPPYKNDDIIAFCRMAKKWDIVVSLYVMMGIPFETLSDYKETLDCVRKCSPTHVSLNIFYPYPGTDLYQKAKDLGLFKDHIIMTDSERRYPVLDLPEFSKSQIRREYILFYIKSLYGIIPISKILIYTLANLLIPYPTYVKTIKKLLGKLGRNGIIGNR